MLGIIELQEVFSLWKKNEWEKTVHFSISFAAKNQKQPLIFLGSSSIVHYLGKRVFSDEELFYLHGLQGSQGKLIFPDLFIKFLSSLTYDLKIKAPKEGSFFFPNEPIIKVVGKAAVLPFFKKWIQNVLPRQIQVATEVEKLASFIAPGVICIENSFNCGKEHFGGDEKSGYIGGAVATKNLSAAKMYHIPIFFPEENAPFVFLDNTDPLFNEKLGSIEEGAPLFLKGHVTKELLEKVSFYGKTIKGVLLDLRKVQDGEIASRFHGCKELHILDEEFQIYRFFYKGLALGDVLGTFEEMEKKKTFFGKYWGALNRVELLEDLSFYRDEPLSLIRNRVVKSMQQLPCKYRGEGERSFYPIRILKKKGVQESEESTSKTHCA